MISSKHVVWKKYCRRQNVFFLWQKESVKCGKNDISTLRLIISVGVFSLFGSIHILDFV